MNCLLCTVIACFCMQRQIIYIYMYDCPKKNQKLRIGRKRIEDEKRNGKKFFFLLILYNVCCAILKIKLKVLTIVSINMFSTEKKGYGCPLIHLLRYSLYINWCSCSYSNGWGVVAVLIVDGSSEHVQKNWSVFKYDLKFDFCALNISNSPYSFHTCPRLLSYHLISELWAKLTNSAKSFLICAGNCDN